MSPASAFLRSKQPTANATPIMNLIIQRRPQYPLRTGVLGPSITAVCIDVTAALSWQIGALQTQDRSL